MKQLLILSLITGLIVTTSCSKENLNEQDLVNKWQLIESLSDPGDGSGRFQKVENEAIIEFFNDNTLRYSKSFCGERSTVNIGTYSSEENKIFADCDPSVSFNFKIESNRLIIYYNCFEACAEKFKLVN